MKDYPTHHPKRWKWRIEWLVQTMAEAIIARLPGPIVFQLGEKIGGLLWHLMGHRRRIVFKNLRIAFAGEKDMSEIRDMARASFRRSVANLISAVHISHMDLDKLESCVELENPQLAEETVRQGNGMLLLPPHMGNWEILSRFNRLFPAGHEVGAFYRPLNNPYLDARVAAKRRSEGTHLFSKRDNLHQVGAFLKNGGMIGVLADQRAGRRGTVVNFFGRLTRSSPLPRLLIRRCKCSAIAISVRTLRPGKWSVKYHSVAAPANTAACMDAIEVAMRESPIDVFWFQDRWKIYAKRGSSINDWLGSNEARSSTHSHRALLWLAGMQSEWQMPEAWKHPDVIYEVVVRENQQVPTWVDSNAIIHRIPVAGSRRNLQKCIAAIDTTACLPVDYILTCGKSPHLSDAARRETIQLISFPS